MSRLRISSLYTMRHIYSTAEPVPWRNSFYVVTLIVVFPKSAHLTSKKVVKITVLVTLSFVCVVMVDVYDYVGRKAQTAELKPNYFLRSTWCPMIGSQQLGQAVCLHMAMLIMLYTLHLVHRNTSALLFFKWARIYQAFQPPKMGNGQNRARRQSWIHKMQKDHGPWQSSYYMEITMQSHLPLFGSFQ